MLYKIILKRSKQSGWCMHWYKFVRYDSDIISVLNCFILASTCLINIHFMLNVCVSIFSWYFVATAQHMPKSLSSAHEFGTVS